MNVVVRSDDDDTEGEECAMKIQDTSLRWLGLISLQEITKGDVKIVRNKDLCYLNKIKIKELQKVQSSPCPAHYRTWIVDDCSKCLICILQPQNIKLHSSSLLLSSTRTSLCKMRSYLHSNTYVCMINSASEMDGN